MRGLTFVTTIFMVVACMLLPISCASLPKNSKQEKILPVKDALESLESNAGGRLGVYAIDTGSGRDIRYRANERFPMCSTSKIMVVSAMLKKSELDGNSLGEIVSYKTSDTVAWSPITAKHFNDGMTVSELCKAAITYSDNTAINLIIKKLGGLEAVNTFAHSIGDTTFRQDRQEPDINTAIPGDVRDTTTPQAMANSLKKLVLGSALQPTKRALLNRWLKENTTGSNKIRAGLPTGWSVGDKTGTGDYGTTNDIGVVWPTSGSPIVMAIYLTQKTKKAPENEAIIASVTQHICAFFLSTRK